MTTTIGRPLPSLAEFMKIYSVVPNGFIDDLFAFYDEDTSQTDIAIDLDKVAKWLQVDRDKLHDTLKHSYKLGVDYTERALPKDAPKRHGGQNKRSEDVRTYFIDVESLMMRYRKQVLTGIRDDVVRLERNQAGRGARRLYPVRASSGYVYVVCASHLKANLLKIGRTNDVFRRMREHNTAQADDIELLFALRTDDPEAVEACAKAMMRRHRYRGGREIYSADLVSIKALISNCDGISSSTVAHLDASESEKGNEMYFVGIDKGVLKK